MIDFFNAPKDVQRVWAIQMHGQPVGTSMFTKIKKIIEDNPTYFKWEHAYSAIPKEVHDAFMKECYPERWEYLNNNDPIACDGGGIRSIIEPRNSDYSTSTKSLKALFEGMIECANKMEEKRFKRKKEVEAIWNKYYKVYGLECRERF